jgi:hypothetical protein
MLDVIKDLDGTLRYLTEELGSNTPRSMRCRKRIWDGQLRLTRQRHVLGKPYSPTDGSLTIQSLSILLFSAAS